MYVRPGLLGTQGSAPLESLAQSREGVTFHLSSASGLIREMAHCRTSRLAFPNRVLLERLSLGLSFRGSQG